jgi:4-hydroxy-tetrahydrodipicolinate synthase
MFTGCITALVTPFKNSKIDYKKLIDLADYQAQAGVSGLVLFGTTGESPTLTDDEKAKILKIVVKTFKGQLDIIAGTGTNDTAKSIKLTKMAKGLGADGALVVTPYYNKPTQAGLFLHFKAIADQASLPLILYNVPGRTGVSIAPETVEKLSHVKGIVAIKEASGNLEQIDRIREFCDITILSGDDGLTFPILCLGGKGVISVTANIDPKDIVALINAFKRSDLASAQAYHYKLAPLNRVLFIESNPIPVKTALKLMGRLNGEMRLPLCPMLPVNTAKLKAVLQQKSIRLL